MNIRCVVLLALVAACATREPEPLPPGLLDWEGHVEPEEEPHGWLGAVLAPNESESLDDLQIRPGLRVRSVAAGSPAEQAGLRPGDVLLAMDGAPTNDPERVEALLHAVRAPRSVTLQLQRGTRVLEVEAGLELRERSGGRTLYHVDRGLVRAAFRDDEGPGAYPEVVYLAPDSPLRKAGVRPGDRIVAFQGFDPGSAAEFVRRLPLELEPGESAALRVRRAGGGEEELEFEAWRPRRVLTRFQLWPLWSWSYEREEDRETLVIGDLLLLSIFKRVRLGHEARWSVLSILRWRTGEAVLERPGAALPREEER